jgi:hypothetical protein
MMPAAHDPDLALGWAAISRNAEALAKPFNSTSRRLHGHMDSKNRNTEKHASAYATEFCNSAEGNAMAATGHLKGSILH